MLPIRLVKHALKNTRYLSGFHEKACPPPDVGLILGIYSMNDGKHETTKLTHTAEKFNKKTCNLMASLLSKAGPAPRLGEYRLFYDIDSAFPIVCVVGLGLECAGYDEEEQIDWGKENIRVAAAVGGKALSQLQLSRLFIEGMGHTESTAEGIHLATYLFQEYKNPKRQKNFPALELYDDTDWNGWLIGTQKAAAQNLARRLTEAPANKMTPITFAQTAVDTLCNTGVNVEVKVENWCECQGMGAFLAVGKGSCESSLFLELSYFGSGCFSEQPVILIGKGLTFDSGGIMLRNKDELVFGKGDLSGAACVVATIKAIAALNLPVNIRGIIPLCENMPGCNAMKPGDIVYAMNGKSIYINDTRYEGRLVLADALCYSRTFCPRFVIDVGSLTRGCRDAMSTVTTGVFSNSDRLWKQLRISAIHTGDRVWRYPLFDHYRKKVTTSTSVDTKNSGSSGSLCSAEPCRAAAFLSEFVPCVEWLHMDNFAVMYSDGVHEPPYLPKGMTGRPTRTIIEFIAQLCCKHNECST